MELDDLDNEFIKYNIMWISLLHLVKNIDLYKEAICKTSSIELTKIMCYLYYDGPINRSSQNKNK
jgi:hypothetical protein